jgi:RecB family exonuclease
MALASLLVSPLMPWDKETANKLAQQAIGSDFRLKLPEDSLDSCLGMLQLIRSPIVSAPQLRRCLKLFPMFLNQDDYLKEHREQARATCNQLITLLDLGGEAISWQELKTAAVPQAIAQMLQPECSREGMAVFQEGFEPWRSVRRLYVLGCSDSHYPRKSAGFSLFTDTELEQIRSWWCQLVTAAEQNSLLRRQFRRQLCSASEHVTFLLPRRDPAGKPLAPSASITFASTLFTGVTDAEELILELDSEAGRAAASGLPALPEQKPEAPRSPEPCDLKFGMNLLELNKRADGSLKPESPSRLEKLMVSPLAWLFERLGVESLDWQPETLDIMSKGTLAHAVFEQLFAPGIPLPENDSIETQVPVLLEGIITHQMPFLNHGEWKVERKHLQQEILKAAVQWREILHQSGAQPVAVEIKLKGELEGIPIHGDADLLLELPANRLYVVDYKKSTSGDRRKRMKAGYDHQAELYRTMIMTGGLKEPEKDPEGLVEKLANIRDTGEIGTLYYLMNDQTALADTSDWLPGSIGNLEEMQTNGSANAMQLIKERFIQLRHGRIELNTPADEKEFKDKRGISPYALHGDTLVGLWMKVMMLSDLGSK